MQPNITTKKYVQRHLKLYIDAKYFIFHLTQVMHASTHSQQRYTVFQFITWWREIFRKGRRYFVGFSAIVSVTQAILAFGRAFMMWGMMAGGMLNRGGVFGMILLSLVLIAAYLVLAYMWLYLIKYLSLNQSFTLRTLREDTHKHFVDLFLTALLKGIFTIGLFILLIIPGIIYSVYWLFNQFINVYDGVFYRNSLNQSESLIKGRWWKTVGNLIVLWLGAVLFFGIFGSLLGQDDIDSGKMMYGTQAGGMMWYERWSSNEWLNMLRAILSGTFSMFLLCVMAKMYLAYKETSTEGGMIAHAHAHAHEPQPQHPHHEHESKHEHTSHTHTWHEDEHTFPHTHHEEHTHEHHKHTEHVATTTHHTTKPAPKKSTPKPRVKKEDDTSSS